MFSISETLSWSKAAFVQHFKVLAAISSINLIPFIVLELIPENGIAAHALTALMLVVSVFVSYFVMAAVYHVGSVAVVGGDISKDAVIGRARTLILPALWIVVLSMFFAFAWLPTIFGVLVASVFTALSLPVLFVEGKRGVAAVATSIALVKGKFWRTVAFTFVGLFITIVPLFVFVFAVASIDPSTGEDFTFVGNLVVNAFTYMIVSPAIAILTFGLYRSLRAVTPEPAAEAVAKREKFVKICGIVGVVFTALIVTALIVALLFGSFGP